MNLKLGHVSAFLGLNGYEWENPQYYSREYMYLHSVYAYGVYKAKNFFDIKCCPNTDDNVVMLYMGDPEDVVSGGINKNNIKNFLYVDISETSFKIVEKVVEPCFGDIDDKCYSFKVVKDLSRDWIKFMLKKEGLSYKNYLMETIEKRKSGIKDSLNYTRKSISKDISKLREKRANAIKQAKESTQQLNNLEKLILDAQKEIQK